MKLPVFVRRYRWSILIILVCAAAWYPAVNYLADFRQPDVAFITTPNDVVAAMLDLAEVTDTDTVYDLGSGDGRIVRAAAERGAKAVGIEIDPELVSQSQEMIREAGLADRVTVRRGNIFKQDLTPATVVTMFLTSTINAQLRPQLDRLRPGTRIVSHMFSMPGAKPRMKRVVPSAESRMDHTIYLWVTPIEWE
jgi:protein-L-isoaspartate O-methyltransferase